MCVRVKDVDVSFIMCECACIYHCVATYSTPNKCMWVGVCVCECGRGGRCLPDQDSPAESADRK